MPQRNIVSLTKCLLPRAFFERVNPAVMKERKNLFLKNNLTITHHPSFDKEFGTYPVLYVDLSVSELVCHFPSR
jgi:hypothetical protein